MTRSNDVLALALLVDATTELAREQGQKLRDDRVEAARAKVRQSASLRRGGDSSATLAAGFLAVTVLTPFLIGHFVLTKTFVLKPDPGVYVPDIRGIGDHFLATYLAGLVAIVLALGIFLVARTPWQYRTVAVVGGWIAIAASLVVLLPMSMSKWHDAEETSMAKLRETAFPFAQHYFNCASWTFGGENGVQQPELWQVHLGQVQGSGVKGCNRVFVYRGWQQVGMFDLPGGNTFGTAITVNYPGWDKPYHTDGSGDVVSENTATRQRYPMNPIATNVQLSTTNGQTLNFSLDGAGSNGFELS